MTKQNFLDNYNSKRAPMGFYTHPRWLAEPINL
jgi:hypothetical protein